MMIRFKGIYSSKNGKLDHAMQFERWWARRFPVFETTLLVYAARKLPTLTEDCFGLQWELLQTRHVLLLPRHTR